MSKTLSCDENDDLTYRVVLHLHPELGVLLADDGELDPDVAALSPAQQTLLEQQIMII